MYDICIDARMLDSGGIGTYLKEIIPRIPRCTFNLSIIVNPAFSNEKCLENCRLIPCSIPIYSIREQVQLSFLIPRCDMFWSPHFNIPIFPIRARKRLVTIHDVFHLVSDSLKWHEKMYAKILIDKAIHLSEQVITVSKFTEKELLNRTALRSNKISVILSGIRPMGNGKNEVQKVQKKYNLPEKFLLFVGNVKPHKNLRGLISAFHLLSQQGFEEFQLVVVGRKDGFIHGENLSELLTEKVKFTGRVDDEDLPAIYQSASVFVFPSLYEGFGLPPLEAMSAGCPVVASNAASIPEICGDAALYVNPMDSRTMCEGIKVVLTNNELRKELIEKGQSRLKSFSWDESAHQHCELFQKICSS